MRKWLYICEDAKGKNIVAFIPRTGEDRAPARLYITAVAHEVSAVVDAAGKNERRTVQREVCFTRQHGAALDFAEGDDYGVAIYRLDAPESVKLSPMPAPDIRVEWD